MRGFRKYPTPHANRWKFPPPHPIGNSSSASMLSFEKCQFLRPPIPSGIWIFSGAKQIKLNKRNIIIMNRQKAKCLGHHPRLFLKRTKISGVLIAAHLNAIIIILNYMVSYICCTLNIVFLFIFIFSPPQEQP